MVGLIQKILCNIIQQHGGEEMLASIKQDLGLPSDFDFQINNDYSDEQWQKLLALACEKLGLDTDQAYDIYAKEFLRDAKERFPVWFEMSKNSYQFLCRQPTIHNNFASGIQDKDTRQAINAKFDIEKASDNKIITRYRSHNKHCGLYKALAREAVNLYKDDAKITETKCMHDKDKECEIHVEWTSFAQA